MSQKVGQNVEYEEKDGEVILRIKADQEIGPSTSGKMMGVASTGGFIWLPNGQKLNLYLGKPQP